MKTLFSATLALGVIMMASPAQASWGACESAIKTCAAQDSTYAQKVNAVRSACKEVKSCKLERRKWSALKTQARAAKRSCKKACTYANRRDRKGRTACKKSCQDTFNKTMAAIYSDSRASQTRRFCNQNYMTSSCKSARGDFGRYVAGKSIRCGAALVFSCGFKALGIK